MKNKLFCVLFLVASTAFAQKNVTTISKDEIVPTGLKVVKTSHKVSIAGKLINYQVQTGYLELKADTGKVMSKIFFTYYKKEGEEESKRPVTFTFNGGPGSASLWLHMGGVGPRRVELDAEGNALPAPYKIIDNEYSWLDKTDLVFIDPVSTG